MKTDSAAGPRLSLRGRQRLAVRTAVLDAALELFTTNGYQKTTIHAIAARAGIGTATLFRHFRSKPALMADLIRRDLREVFQTTQAIVDNPPDDPVEATCDLLLAVASILDKPSKSIRINPYIWPAMPTGKRETDEVVKFGDRECNRQIRDLLKHFQRRNLIDRRHKLDDLTTIIFYVFNCHYVDHIFGAIKSRRDLDRKLIARIPVLFAAWAPPRDGCH